MNRFLFAAAALWSSLTLSAQSDETPKTNGRFGFGINNSLHGVGAICVAPVATYLTGKHQLEAGPAIYPGNMSDDYRLIGGELNYRFFPNSIEKRFSMYFICSLSYTYEHDTYTYGGLYPGNNYQIYTSTKNEHYLGLLGGYGFQVTVLKNGYVGTHLNVGTITSNYKKTSSYNGVSTGHFFQDFDLDAKFQINFGWRF